MFSSNQVRQWGTLKKSFIYDYMIHIIKLIGRSYKERTAEANHLLQ